MNRMYETIIIVQPELGDEQATAKDEPVTTAAGATKDKTALQREVKFHHRKAT